MILLPLTYFGPISWWKLLQSSKDIVFDIHENYIKQTYRNRCTILSANGKLNLSIPVKKTFGNHTAFKDIKIENNQNWQTIHSRAVMSAYKASPFYDYLIDDMNVVWTRKYDYLLDVTLDSMSIIFKILNIKPNFNLSNSYVKADNNDIDLRKIKNFSNFVENSDNDKYQQVFNDRFCFESDLSIVDKIFNTNSL
ncbi:WbqC family protein [Odoribacter sp. OttesenSCG-928-L07]|nr:WbqC family protein [Odoribacter sp. OttesenSCG-928-L07]